MKSIAEQRIDSIVYRRLLENIKKGIWRGGNKLPSEPELSKQLSVSRASVRSALNKLKVIGLIKMRKGFLCVGHRGAF